MSRGDLTEAEWRVLKDLLPIEPENRSRGRPPEQNRSISNGILFRCGAPWRDVPPKYGSWNTIYRRFRRWSEAGVWEAVAVTFAEIMADSGHYSIDSTTVRAHVSAAGGKRGTHRRTLGRSRGGFTSKVHCLADALGRPVAFHLTGGEAANFKAYDDLIDLPEQASDAFLADKGYDADAIRADLAERKIKAVIPGRSNRRVKIEYDRVLYKQRNRIERMFGQLKINRAIATRYDQLANSFLGMVHLATARYWPKFVHAA
ncbi:IS5 family transposase [Novosphingobium sp. 1949]|uniref:IS5 family transposase n=1 Tax=Novosphingobium organovorum TaxID=2930092 RepID=A0ABT0BAE2_9SPHN|nr:IS5 family transposase [Novosphingobium organovorum]MCJ2182021.1 IS5 family transposase [Novosphingobium organovorum]